MLLLTQVKLPVDHTEEELKAKAARVLKIRPDSIRFLRIRKRSLDARKKDQLLYVYELVLSLDGEKEILKKNQGKGNVSVYEKTEYHFHPVACPPEENNRPVIIGLGPAGLFCGYVLAKNGLRPILIERGERVKDRTESVNRFWEDGALNPDSNVQFGEGGAGTFSDGKLTTLVKDKEKRGQLVLETFVKMGAPEDILYVGKPHIGTDILRDVVERLREEILREGGEIHYTTRMEQIHLEDGQVSGISCVNWQTGAKTHIACRRLVLAPGHSARDTFAMLRDLGVPMERKPFAVGVRMEHPQEFINRVQYGEMARVLPPADYRVTAHASDGRGVYSFCMCPGGYVVNASSEAGHLAVNGMSYHDRSSPHANSAIIVTVTPDDFAGEDVLAGVAFQRDLEKKAYETGGGAIPVQTWKSFSEDLPSTPGSLTPVTKGSVRYAELSGIFPDYITRALKEGIRQIDAHFHGFAMDEALLLAVESRSSSPVRILRDEDCQSSIRGLYPCGEGAGYAGGIMSAAMDGIRVAEALTEGYETRK